MIFREMACKGQRKNRGTIKFSAISDNISNTYIFVGKLVNFLFWGRKNRDGTYILGRKTGTVPFFYKRINKTMSFLFFLRGETCKQNRYRSCFQFVKKMIHMYCT